MVAHVFNYIVMSLEKITLYFALGLYFHLFYEAVTFIDILSVQLALTTNYLAGILYSGCFSLRFGLDSMRNSVLKITKTMNECLFVLSYYS